jgi:plastocyanin domain-containing protein
MADKTTITPQQRFKVLTKLFEAGFKAEKDLQSINFQNVFRIEGLTVQDMSIISELQQYTKSNKLYSYLGGMFDEQKEQ